MVVTVASLIAHPDAKTYSLTPGIGEDRNIAWGHVCELPEPWALACDAGTLVMSTGLAVPAEADRQSAYFAGMAEAGIAGLAVDEKVTVAKSALEYAAKIGFPVLATNHETPFATLVRIIAEGVQREPIRIAVRQQGWTFGTILLNNLLDGSLPSQAAESLLAAHGVTAPYRVGAGLAGNIRTGLEPIQDLLGEEAIPALVTLREEYVLLLLSESSVDALDPIAAVMGGVGVSATHYSLSDLSVAARQSQVALARARGETSKVVRFDVDQIASLFLPKDQGGLRAVAKHVLGSLQDYDESRGTALTHTLRVFLEENRSWVRAAKRLYVHRQTLAARIERIETVLARDFSSTEDTAECWFGIRAAVLCGEIDPVI